MDIKKSTRAILKGIYRWFKDRRYAFDAHRGGPAGTYAYRFSNDGQHGHLPITVWIRADDSDALDRKDAEAWLRRQTIPEIRMIGVDQNGQELWRIAPAIDTAFPDSSTWFAAPGELPNFDPYQLESSFLVAAAEDVDAVILLQDGGPPIDTTRLTAGGDCAPPYRAYALYRSDAYAWDAAADEIRALKDRRVIKIIGPRAGKDREPSSRDFNRFQRGPYLSTTELSEELTVPVRDAGLVKRYPVKSERPAVLVTAPFLARGGVEQTLYATMHQLADRFDFSVATLAPHREALGDRRADFMSITNRLFWLGDLVHPDVMLGMIESILESTGAQVIYNANGTTLFYDFAHRLKENRPGLRIVDHLYDHEVGYIDRYDPSLLSAVDVCVAENHQIADHLVQSCGWPAERAPVIWPCGRPNDELPSPASRAEIRNALRTELALSEDDVVVLTAARMHPQKRPLDLVRLAERVQDLEHLHFVAVGGGDLEHEMDREISSQPDLKIRRLPFRTDVPDLIVAADVGCLVSEFEGLPVFMLECLQLGKPFLGTRVGDLGRVLDETGAGVVVDQPGDLDRLEAAVRQFADSKFRADLSEKAIAAGPRFSVENCADAYQAVFLGNN